MLVSKFRLYSYRVTPSAPTVAIFFQVEEGFSKAVFVDMVQQGGELERVVTTGSFANAVQSV